MKLSALIRQGIEYAKTNNIKISPGLWYDPDTEAVCLLSAAYLSLRPNATFESSVYRPDDMDDIFFEATEIPMGKLTEKILLIADQFDSDISASEIIEKLEKERL